MTSLARGASPRRTALIAATIAVGMLGLGFAAVPLYRIFCAVTGFDGTTQRATEAQYEASAVAVQAQTQGQARQLSIRFDSNTANGLAWDFYPEKRRV